MDFEESYVQYPNHSSKYSRNEAQEAWHEAYYSGKMKCLFSNSDSDIGLCGLSQII